MERFTKRAISVRGEFKACCVEFESELCCKLEGDCSKCPVNDKAWEKLAAYEDAEEQGLLVRLPCKAGDAITATVLRPYNGHSAKIHGEVSDVQIVVRVVYDSGRHINFLSDDFGKTVFLTREEAEKALEEAQSSDKG